MQNRLRVTCQFFESFKRFFRVHHLHQFYFVELVNANDALVVTPSTPGLATETRCVSRHFARQLVFSQDLVAAQELLLLEKGHCLRDQTLAYCTHNANETSFQANSLATLVQMVAMNQGSSVVPLSAVAVETRRAAVRALPFAEPVPGRVLRLIWRTRSPHVRALTSLAALFAQTLVDALAGVSRELEV